MSIRNTPATDLPELLRVAEVAEWLDCGSVLVRDLIRRNELQSIRLGRLLRVPRAALVALANGRLTGGRRR